MTRRIVLDQITTGGTGVNSLPVPASMLMATFPSRSELALNLSQEGGVVTFMGYVAPVNPLDISNSNTAGAVDPTNPRQGPTTIALRHR